MTAGTREASRLTYRNVEARLRALPAAMSQTQKDERVRDWHPVTAAPYETALQLAVIEDGEVYALVFPCHRTHSGWSHAQTGAPVYVRPTHWRIWSE